MTDKANRVEKEKGDWLELIKRYRAKKMMDLAHNMKLSHSTIATIKKRAVKECIFNKNMLKIKKKKII